jgi:hypothetical protein
METMRSIREACEFFTKMWNYEPSKGIAQEYVYPERLELTFANDYGLSVIRGRNTYGGHEGKFEIAVLLDGEITYFEGITEECDAVIGWLTADEVIDLALTVACK